MPQLDIANQIKACLFSGLSEEVYLSHVKILESANDHNDQQPVESKPRYILLALNPKSNKGNIYKSKRNSNGTFSIGKTWPLDSLRGLQLINSNMFKISLNKSYVWKSERPTELLPFLEAVINTYNKCNPSSHPLKLKHSQSPSPQSTPQLQSQQQPKPSSFNKHSNHLSPQISDKNVNRSQVPLQLQPRHHPHQLQQHSSQQPQQTSSINTVNVQQPSIKPPRSVERTPQFQTPPQLPSSQSISPPIITSSRLKPSSNQTISNDVQNQQNESMNNSNDLSKLSPHDIFKPPSLHNSVSNSSINESNDVDNNNSSRLRSGSINSNVNPSQILQSNTAPLKLKPKIEDQQHLPNQSQKNEKLESLSKLSIKPSIENVNANTELDNQEASSPSPIIRERSQRRKISRPSDASLGDAFTSLARKPSTLENQNDSFNDIQHIDEALGGANWRSLRSFALENNENVLDEQDEKALIQETTSIENSMIRSIVHDDEENLNNLFNYLDSSIGELDDMDAVLNKFKANIMLIGEDLNYIESQRGKFSQNDNQKALISEIEKLDNLSSNDANVDQADLIVLTKESLESDKGIAALERAAATLYKAIKASDEQVVDEVDNEKRLQDYKTITLQFAKRMHDYLSIMFKFQVDNLLNDPSRQISESKPKIKSHEKMENYLGRYCGLVLFLRDMDQERYKQVCANYFSSASEIHSKEIKKLLNIFSNKIHRASEEESDANFSNPIENFASGGRKRSVKRNDKRSKRVEEIPAFEALDRALIQISPSMKAEETFIQDLLAIMPTAPTFADYVDLDERYKVKSKERMKSINFGSLNDIKNAMELVFGFLHQYLQSWLDGALVKDNMQIVGLIATLEKFMKLSYDKSQPYLHSLLKKQKSRLNSMFSKYISDQIKAIENTKLTTKKRKGISPFIRIIPSFVTRLESQLSKVGDDWEIRINVNDAYDKIIGRMFDSLKRIANEEDFNAEVAAEDKGQLNLHVIMIANSHHFLQSFKTQSMNSITIFIKQATDLYKRNMDHYVKILWRRHISKQIDYFEGLEKALKSNRASEMISHPNFGKSVYKRVVRDFTAKDLKKSCEALQKRVEKHFEVGIEDEGSYNEALKVMDAVWRALEEEIINYTREWNELIQICFASLEGLHYTQTDIKMAFKKSVM